MLLFLSKRNEIIDTALETSYDDDDRSDTRQLNILNWSATERWFVGYVRSDDLLTVFWNFF